MSITELKFDMLVDEGHPQHNTTVTVVCQQNITWTTGQDNETYRKPSY